MLLVLGALAFGAKAQTPMVKDSLPFEGQLQKAQQKIDSLQKVIQQLTTKPAVSPQKRCKISHKTSSEVEKMVKNSYCQIKKR